MAGMWLFADKQQELHKYTVLGCVESGLRYPSIYGLKALVSCCKTKGFRMRNQGFLNGEVSTLKSVSKTNETQRDC